MTLFVRTVSLGAELGRIAVDAAIVESVRRGVVTCCAVMDAAAHLVTFVRMDGAPLLAVQLAQDKAYTVAIHGLASHQWWDVIRDDASLVHGINKIDRLIIFGGGLPVTYQGKVIGSVAVSGKSSSEQDQLIAQVAVDAIVAHIELAAVG